ncbi:unnamed protein product [Calypogeia fissa]
MSDFSCREAGRRGPGSGASGQSGDRAGKWRLGRMASGQAGWAGFGTKAWSCEELGRFWGEGEIMKTALQYVLALLGHPPTARGQNKKRWRRGGSAGAERSGQE